MSDSAHICTPYRLDGNAIRLRIKSLGLTQDGVAKQAGIPVGCLRRMVSRRQTNVHLPNTLAVLKVIGYRIEDVVCVGDDPKAADDLLG